MNTPNFDRFEEDYESEEAEETVRWIEEQQQEEREDAEAYDEDEQQQREKEAANSSIIKRTTRALGEFIINKVNRNLERRLEKEDKRYTEYIRRR